MPYKMTKRPRIRWSDEQSRMGFLADIIIRVCDSTSGYIRMPTEDVMDLLMMVHFYRLGVTPEEAAESDAMDDAKTAALNGIVS